MTAQNLPYEPEFEQAYKGMSKKKKKKLDVAQFKCSEFSPSSGLPLDPPDAVTL